MDMSLTVIMTDDAEAEKVAADIQEALIEIEGVALISVGWSVDDLDEEG